MSAQQNRKVRALHLGWVQVCPLPFCVDAQVQATRSSTVSSDPLLLCSESCSMSREKLLRDGRLLRVCAKLCALKRGCSVHVPPSFPVHLVNDLPYVADLLAVALRTQPASLSTVDQKPCLRHLLFLLFGTAHLRVLDHSSSWKLKVWQLRPRLSFKHLRLFVVNSTTFSPLLGSSKRHPPRSKPYDFRRGLRFKFASSSFSRIKLQR